MTNASVVVEGLNVCIAAASGKNTCMKMPKAFSRDELQIDVEEIATPEKLAKWKDLNEILHEISQSSDVEIANWLEQISLWVWSEIESSQGKIASLMLSKVPYLDDVYLAQWKKR